MARSMLVEVYNFSSCVQLIFQDFTIWFSIWGIYWEHLQCCWFSNGFSTEFSIGKTSPGSVAKLSRSDPLQSEDPRELKLRLGWVDESFSPMENTWKKITILIAGWWFGTMEFYDFPFSWEFHHPNWLSLIYFSEGLKPPTRYLLWFRWACPFSNG